MYDIPFIAVTGPLGSILIDKEMKQPLSLLSTTKPPHILIHTSNEDTKRRQLQSSAVAGPPFASVRQKR